MNNKKFIKGLKEGFKNFGSGVSIIINTLLLLLVYFLGVGLASIFAKLVGKHFLDMKLKKETYWVDYNLKKKSLQEYYKQY